MMMGIKKKKRWIHCKCSHVGEFNPAYASNNRPIKNPICGSNFILANRKWGGLAYKAETLKVHCYHRQWEIKKGLLLSTIVFNQENCARSSSNISTMAFHSKTCFIIMILVPGGAFSWGTHAAGRVPGIFRIVTHTCLVLHLQLEREQDLVKLPVLGSDPDCLGEVPESRVQPSGSMEGLGSGVEDKFRFLKG